MLFNEFLINDLSEWKFLGTDVLYVLEDGTVYFLNDKNEKVRVNIEDYIVYKLENYKIFKDFQIEEYMLKMLWDCRKN